MNIKTQQTQPYVELRGLANVRLHKSSLLEAIKENRVKHAHQYDEAYTGWKVEVIKQLENDTKARKKEYRRMVKEHKRCVREAEQRLERALNNDFKTDEKFFQVKMPEHHIEDYNGAIRKLEMSLDDELELGLVEFNQFVMDQWSWKQDFSKTWSVMSGSLTAYNATASSMVGGSMFTSMNAVSAGTCTSSGGALFITGSAANSLLDGTYTSKGTL